MRVYLYFISILFLLFPIISHAIPCPASCDTKGACAREFFIGSKKITYYSNFPLNKKNSCINQVIYAVHGTERNAETRFFSVLNAAKSIGKQNTVLIISPFFKSTDDSPAANDYYWSDSGWKKGDASINNGTQLSSFTIADTILDTVITNTYFPSLHKVTITGHSAGGQYTQLYALTTANPEKHPLLPYQFLVLNPSNYSYLNNLRPHPSISNLFELPVYWNGSAWQMKAEYKAVAGNCPTSYDNYKFGLEQRNAYASQFSSANLIAQYIKRKVYYLLGELDTDPNDPQLDTTCPAKLEGPYRLKRGQNFYTFLNQYFSDHQHVLKVVPGIGHDGLAMYNSEVVKAILFN